MSPHSDPEPENSKSIFLHSTLVQDGASPYQVKGTTIQKISSINILKFAVTLTLTTTIPFLHKHSGL